MALGVLGDVASFSAEYASGPAYICEQEKVGTGNWTAVVESGWRSFIQKYELSED